MVKTEKIDKFGAMTPVSRLTYLFTL